MRSSVVRLALSLVACSCTTTPTLGAGGSDSGAPTGGAAPVDGATADRDGSSGAGGARGDAATLPEAGVSGVAARDVPGFVARPYLLHLPPGVTTGAKVPVVLVLHGGGGAADGTRRLTCPLGLQTSPRCLEALADRQGFAVVYPNGTAPAITPNVRTWNAGGGSLGWQCVSGYACNQHVDDLAYFRALLDDLTSVVALDPRRVYATGISNGAAMSERLACELADRVAAIASVAGGNQHSTTAPCTPSRPVSVLEIHGTEDPCWAFDGGPAACAQKDGLNKIGVPRTFADWITRSSCGAASTVTTLPDRDPSDGTTASTEAHSCAGGSEVTLAKIVGGGHTWPGGLQYQPVASVGRVSRDFDANEMIWAFFAAHPMP